MSRELIQLGIDSYRGSVLNYSTAEANEVMRKAFIDMMGTDKPTDRQFRKHKNEIFEIIEVILDEIVGESWQNNVFFEQFVEYRDLNLGDTNEFYVEDKTMLSISRVADGHWDLRRQKLDIGESFTVSTEVYGASVYGDFLRFVAGRLDWSGLINKIQEAMKLKVATEIYANFMSTMNYLPAEFKESGSFSEDKMLDIVEHTRIANGYAPVVIAGTKKALKTLMSTYTGVNHFMMSDNMKDKLNTQGQIEVWNGIPLLEIPQVHSPNTFEFMLEDNKLMILPANTKPIKFIREGESRIREVSDGTQNIDMSMEYVFLTRFGIATIFNQMFGFYELV